MFFIGIMGVDQREKALGSTGAERLDCPGCGAPTRLDIFRTNSFFHVFFIPLFRWNIRYYARTGCCRRVFELDPETGRAFEAGESPEIRAEHLKPAGWQEQPGRRTCRNCGRLLAPDHVYCPTCGQRQPEGGDRDD